MKEPGNLVSGEHLLLVHRLSCSGCVPTCQKKLESSLGSLSCTLNPFIKVPPTSLNHLSKASLPNIIILGFRMSTNEVCEDTKI